MGTWGKGVLEEDLALDVYGDFLERYNDGADPRKLHKQILEAYAQALSTPEFPSVWLGIAKAQWECGCLAPEMLRKVRTIVAEGSDLSRWQEEDRQSRKRVLDRFLSRVSAPNPKPKGRVKKRSRKAVFQPGACLAVETYRGGYGAAIVLKVTPDRTDPLHLVGGLRGLYSKPPPMHVYEKRDWLYLTRGHFAGELHLVWCPAGTFKRDSKERAIIEVGKTRLRADDPTAEPFQAGSGYAGWGWIENQIRREHEEATR